MPHDPILRLLGLARKAGRLEIGEEPVGAACRARQAKLVLLASDASPNTRRRCAHFGQAGNVLWLELPATKAELGLTLGRGSCAMLALTDAGLAGAVAEKLERLDPEKYAPAAGQLKEKASKSLQRQREQRRHEKNLQAGRKKPWAAPPQDRGPSRPKGGTAPARKGGPDSARPGPGSRRLTSRQIPKKRGGFPV